jgi:hypothetical protein
MFCLSCLFCEQGVKADTMHMLKSLKALVSKEDHYAKYKQKQELSLPPSIPFLGKCLIFPGKWIDPR